MPRKRNRGDVAVGRMPVQHDVHIVEETGAREVDLAGTACLRGRAVEAHCAGRSRAGEPVRDRDRSDRRRAAEQVMAASLAGRIGHDRLAARHRRLGEARQRIELGQDADHGAAGPATGHERGGNAGNAPFEIEPVLLQVAGKPFGAAHLEVAELGVVEEVSCQCHGLGSPGIDGRCHVGVRRCDERPRCDHERCDGTSPAQRVMTAQGVPPQPAAKHGSSP